MNRTQKITPATPRRTKAIPAATMTMSTTKKNPPPGELLLLELGAGEDACGGLFTGWKTLGGGCIGLGLNPGGLAPTGGAAGGLSKMCLLPLMNCTPQAGHLST